MIELLVLSVNILCVMFHKHKIRTPVLTLLELFPSTDVAQSLCSCTCLFQASCLSYCEDAGVGLFQVPASMKPCNLQSPYFAVGIHATVLGRGKKRST